MFITLHHKEKQEPVVIKADKIIRIEDDADGGKIWLSVDHWIQVKETVPEMLKLLTKGE